MTPTPPGAHAMTDDSSVYTPEEVAEAMEVLRGRHGSTALHDEVLDGMERALTAAITDPPEPRPDGQAVAYVSKDDCMFTTKWSSTTPMLYSEMAPGRIPIYTIPEPSKDALTHALRFADKAKWALREAGLFDEELSVLYSKTRAAAIARATAQDEGKGHG